MRLFPDGLQNYRVQISEQSCCQSFYSEAAANARLRFVYRSLAGSRWVDAQNGRRHIAGGGAPAKPVGAASRQQFVKQDAQGIYVCGGGNRLARDLFRAGVIWGQCASCEPRNLGLGRLAILEQLGDAEVEQAHQARIGNQNVRRLQVAVHHQIGMGVLNCLQYFLKQPQARANVQPMVIAILGDRLAFDILQRQIRLPLRGHACIVEARDACILKPRQNVALPREPVRQRLAIQVEERKLESHLAFQRTVRAHGEPDHTHATPAQLAIESIWAGQHTRRERSRCGGRLPRIVADFRQRSEEVRLRLGQQFPKCRQKVWVFRFQTGQPCLPPLLRKTEPFVHEGGEHRPGFGVHLHDDVCIDCQQVKSL